MTTTVHITFEDDGEAAHFAAMLTEKRGVIYRPAEAPAHGDIMWEENWPAPHSITAVETEADDDGP